MIITRNDFGIPNNRFLFKELETETSSTSYETPEDLRTPEGLPNMDVIKAMVRQQSYGIERRIN